MNSSVRLAANEKDEKQGNTPLVPEVSLSRVCGL
jgi:hypothetical protein